MTGTITTTSGSFLSGTSKTLLYDKYALDWFTKIAEATEKRAIDYIEEHGEPEDYHQFHVDKKGNLGLRVSIHVKNTENGKLNYIFHIGIDKFAYEAWAKEHLYLMESFMTFRIGPIIVAHPGRNQQPLYIAGIQRKRPINIWEVEFGLLTEHGTDWFNLERRTIVVSAIRNKNNEWLIHRLR